MMSTGKLIVWERVFNQQYILYFYAVEIGKEFGYAEQNATNEPFQFSAKSDLQCFDAEDLRLIASALDTIGKL